MTRRFSLTILALAATASLLLAACGAQTPQAPALTDPKEILSQSVVSFKDVKTVEFTGTVTGKVQAAELGGEFDLSGITMSGALDVPNKKAKFLLDAPTLMGTKLEALLLDRTAYLKGSGLMSMVLGTSADKYTKTEIPEASGDPLSNAADVAKAVDEIKQALDKLPTAPTKAADEKCGDQDCYHVTLKLTGADMAKMEGSAPVDGDLTFDLWSRKNDLRPAKLTLTVSTPDQGTFGLTIELKYDVPVSVEAPAADQVAP